MGILRDIGAPGLIIIILGALLILDQNACLSWASPSAKCLLNLRQLSIKAVKKRIKTPKKLKKKKKNNQTIFKILLSSIA